MRHARFTRSTVVRNERTGQRVRIREEYTVPALDSGQRGTLPDGDVLAEQHGVYLDLHYIDADGAPHVRRRAQNPVSRLKLGQRVLVVVEERLPSEPGAALRRRCWPGVVEEVEKYDALMPETADKLRILNGLLREAEEVRAQRKK